MFVGKMCVFVSRQMKIATFLLENGDSVKRVDDFPRERDTFRNKIMEIVEHFDEKRYNNNGKPWKSSRILRVNPNFFIFLELFIFFLYFSFLLHFFHFFIFFNFSFSSFLNFSIFSFFFFFFIFFVLFPSFSFIFSLFSLHFLSFSFSLLCAQNLIYFWPQFRYDFS